MDIRPQSVTVLNYIRFQQISTGFQTDAVYPSCIIQPWFSRHHLSTYIPPFPENDPKQVPPQRTMQLST